MLDRQEWFTSQIPPTPIYLWSKVTPTKRPLPLTLLSYCILSFLEVAGEVTYRASVKICPDVRTNRQGTAHQSSSVSSVKSNLSQAARALFQQRRSMLRDSGPSSGQGFQGATIQGRQLCGTKQESKYTCIFKMGFFCHFFFLKQNTLHTAVFKTKDSEICQTYWCVCITSSKVLQ